MTWQPIETAPKDGTPIIGGYFHTPWSESHLRGQIVKCWYQPEFGAFIAGCREMEMAPGYSFEDGSSKKLHSPEYAPVSHWMPIPETPTPSLQGDDSGANASATGLGSADAPEPQSVSALRVPSLSRVKS